MTTDAAIRIWMQGAITMGYLVVAFFFISFWRETRDRMFIMFAAGFAILTLHRSFFALTFDAAHWTDFTFALRLIGYLCILAGILDRRARTAALTTREE